MQKADIKHGERGIYLMAPNCTDSFCLKLEMAMRVLKLGVSRY